MRREGKWVEEGVKGSGKKMEGGGKGWEGVEGDREKRKIHVSTKLSHL